MKNLEASFTKHGSKILGAEIDLGDWDIALGLERTLYFTNVNPHAKGILKAIKNRDSRVKIKFTEEDSPNIVKEIMPNEKIAMHVSIAAAKFETEEEEIQFFKKVKDQVSGIIRWEVP
ncbi:hypothetical protein LCGC14_2591850 [marine sediment metagenome]|uniref:Uncharacterized protein n=1 Tax=marine sediment metagenome TaxID=412755 RepID=A0A0F9AZB3_9ZZZZ